MGENPKNESANKVSFVWFELPGLEEVDISSWINPNGTLNSKIMQAEIKKDLEEAVAKTERWQKKAIQFSVPTN